MTAMLTLANIAAPPQTQAPSPAMAPKATKLEPGQEVQGWVCVQTQHGPHCPAWALAAVLYPILGPWGEGQEGLAREERVKKVQALRTSPSEKGTHPSIPLGAVRERKRGETSDGAS